MWKKKKPQVCDVLKYKYRNPYLTKTTGYNIKADWKPKEVVEKCGLPKKRKCGKKVDPTVCGSLFQWIHGNQCLAKTAGYNVSSECKGCC